MKYIGSYTFRFELFLVAFIIMPCLLFSQGVDGRRTGQPSQTEENISERIANDTVLVDTIYSYYLYDPLIRSKVNKELKDILVFPYNPVKNLSNEDAHLGNLGSPYYRLFYHTDERIGLRIGGHPYAKYSFANEDFTFYDLKSGYTDIYYSQTGQPNSLFDGLLARNFAKGESQFVIKYRRINQEGIYQNQNVKNTILSTGLKVPIIINMWESSILFSTNLFTQNNNGGITDDAILTGAFETERMNVPVNLTSSRGKDHKIQYTVYNTLKILKNRRGPKLELFQKTQFDIHNFLKIDDSPESEYHKNYFITSDSLIYSLAVHSLRNQVGIKVKLNADNPIRLKSQIEYNRHNISASTFDQSINDIILRNNVSFTYKEKYLVHGKLDLGLSDKSGEIHFNGLIAGSLGQDIHYKTEIDLLTQRPQYIENNIVLNDSLLITNNIGNQKSFSWKSTVTSDKLGLSLSYNSILINDFIYWDSDRLVRQADKSISLQQIAISSKLKWKFIHLYSDIKFQVVGDDLLLRLPKIMVNETFFTEGSVFKKRLNFRTGLNLRLLGNYEYVSYYPILGIYHHAEETRGASYYPDANAFIEIKVDSFKFYFLFENVFQYFSDDIEFELANYPQFDQRLRVGFRWIFRN